MNLSSGGVHRIAQHANAGDADLNDIAIDEWADSGGCAGGYEVTGFESHHAGQPADQIGRGKNHERSVARLANLAVYEALDQDIVRQQVRFNMRAGWTESIEALGARELNVRFLQVAGGHIIQAGIAENIAEWIFSVG